MIGAAVLGLSLALVNVGVIGVGLLIVSLQPVVLMVAFDTMPFAAPTGVVLGLVAHGLRRAPLLVRHMLLTMPALLVVAWLGRQLRASELVPFAAVPTVIGCLVLERLTRRPADPAVPRAVASYESSSARV